VLYWQACCCGCVPCVGTHMDGICALHSTTMPAALSIHRQERLLRTAVRYSLATGRLVADGSCFEQALQGSVLCFKWTYVVVHLRGCCVFASSVRHTCLACLAQFKQQAP
jgi:hypothetical protein